MRWLSAILIVVVVIGSLVWIKYSQVMAAIAFGQSFPEPSETVNAVTTYRDIWSPTFTVLGEVKSPKEAMLRNELEGVIEKINLTPGQVMEKGTLLLQLNVQEETAQLRAAQARIELAELDVGRLGRLSTANAASQDQFDRAKVQLKVAKAEAAALQALIDRKSVYAPFTGVVGLHDLDEGEYLAANSSLARLVAKQDAFWIDFSVPQNQAFVDIGDTVTIVDEDDLKSYTASVIAVEPQLNLQSRSLPVRARIDNAGRLAPGEMVLVRIAKAQQLDVMPIPVEAIRYDSFGSFVFVLNKDDKGQYRAERRPVTVAYSDEKIAIVAAGLNENETVATRGSYKLSGGKLTFIKAVTSTEADTQ